MKYLIYARVSARGSSWTGTETTIPDQIEDCRRYALARDPGADFDVVEDEFLSGASTRRPGYRRLLHELESGTATWDVLLVRHLDRLSRSLTDAIPLLRLLQTHGKGLISVHQHLDLSSPTGRAMLHIILVFAEWEREINSERTKAKMVSICEAGGWPVGRPPIGYRRPGKRQNVLVPDPETAPKVRELFRAYVDGAAPADLCRQHKLPRTQFWNILRNPFYIGTIRYGGRDYPGGHEPLIERELWEAAQPSIPEQHQVSRPRTRAQSRPYVLAGLVHCHCGRAMTAYSSRGKSGKAYHYYQCTGVPACRNRVSAPTLEEEVTQALSAVQYEPADVEKLVGEIRRARDRSRAETDPEVRRLAADEKRLAGDLSKMERAFLDGLVSRENAALWNRRLHDTAQDLEAVRNRQTQILAEQSGPGSRWALAEAAARELPGLGALLASAADSPDELRRLLAAHIDHVTVAADGTWEAVLSTGGRLAQEYGMASPRGLVLTLKLTRNGTPRLSIAAG